jgi:uncharacterized protein DUF3253
LPEPSDNGPVTLRRELESELTEARRLEVAARVRDAELALGDLASGGDPAQAGGAAPGGRVRGAGAAPGEGERVRLAAAMRALLWHRRPEATICPSDAARAVGGDSWRDLMDEARAVAGDLAREGVLIVRQRGADVDLTTATGPIRLARGPGWPRRPGPRRSRS